MMRYRIIAISAVFLLFTFALFCPAFSLSQTADYLCETGIAFYYNGRYDEALQEFNKALILDPANKIAKGYINIIFMEDMAIPIQEEITSREEPGRQETIEQTLSELDRYELKREERLQGEQFREEYVADKKVSGVKITGETQVSFGVAPDDTLWKRANADLNERNFRMASNTAYDKRTNTYDPRVYDRLRVNLDTDNQEGFNFHTNITVDPWSFTGKTNRITLNGTGGDTAEIELKYWSNTRYTINETVFTLQNGDSFALPEIKVKDGKIMTPSSVTSTFSNTFNIPELKIKREFQPLREFWFDYKQEGIKLRLFPIAYQDQALTFDDPLRLSNNHIWWEESPWLDRWLPGRLNTGASPDDFTKGEFDDSLSFFTRDSDGTRLTALRGLSFEFTPDERTYLANTFASPKGLWQDYGNFDNLINASRFKYRLLDNLGLGSLFTYRVGYNENNKKDVTNYVWAIDSDFEVTEGLKLSLETAVSKTRRDISSDGFLTEPRGNAYHVSLTGTFPKKSLMDLKYGYSGIKPEEGDMFFTKYRFYAVQMNKGFDPTLTTYRETRDDTFWSRHIHFRNPFEYYYSGLYQPDLKWEDVEPFRIGNGIDIGRSVLGFRIENSLWDKQLENLFDVRNVHRTDGKFVENVAREEITYRVDDKLTTKALAIYHKLPKTKAGIDPFVFDSDTGIFLNNAAIGDAKDPTLKTGSLGLEYAFTDRIALSGIWERTNDYTLAYDNFPRGILNSSSFTTFTEFGKVFRREDPFLHTQGLFPLPPYPFYNIFKAGLGFEPLENLHLYLDYTRNEFKSAGQIDDNINHIGLEASYAPTKKLGFYLRYTYSRWNDINRMTGGFNKIYLENHNFFTEFRYLPTDDNELVMQYGESGRSPLAITSFDPYGGSLATLDTRHILRIYYRRKF